MMNIHGDEDRRVSDAAGPVSEIKDRDSLMEWQKTEVNLNHLDQEADKERIASLKAAYEKRFSSKSI